VVLEVAPGIEVRYMKRAIMDVVSPGEETDETDTDSDEDDEHDEHDEDVQDDVDHVDHVEDVEDDHHAGSGTGKKD
jgi:preprotein translocase subunit YajC